MNANYQSYETVTQSILGFAVYAREHELQVGVREAQEALTIASLGLMGDKEIFRYALKSVFCSCAENANVFDQLFADYWGLPKASVTSRITMKNQLNAQKQMQRSLVLLGKGENSEGKEEEAKNVSGANAAEQLRKTDFSKLSEMDSEYLEKLATDLWKQMSKRLKKKLKNSTTKGRIDLRQTIRNNIGSGGAMLELKRKYKKPSKNRLIILLDVSGSMDKYSFFLLRFILALRTHFKRIDAYIFSTTLIRITDILHIRELESVLRVLSQHADNWSSGTKIGECLKHFNQQFAKRALSGKNMTIVLSDGLDTGEPEVLATELHKIKRRTRRLIWLNPLKGMPGYQPRTRGMMAALPEIDHFMPAHNVESLLQLETFLSNV